MRQFHLFRESAARKHREKLSGDQPRKEKKIPAAKNAFGTGFEYGFEQAHRLRMKKPDGAAKNSRSSK
jgi:hypothetical protein